MRVESFTSTNGLTRYILVDSSGVPVDVVLRFLRFKDNCGRARNTLRAYCFHLKSYFEYLEFIGMSFPQIGMDELAGFIRWLQNNHRQKKIMSFPAATVSTCSAQTINVYLSTVYAFYDYLSRHEEYRLRLSDKFTRTIMGSRRGFKDFLYHINRTRQYDTRVIRLIEPQKRIKTLKKSEVENLLSACLTTRDRFLIQLLWESGLRIGEALALWLEDIEPDAHRIHIVDRGELTNLSEIKTVCSPRTVDVSADLINLFFEYIVEAHTDDVDTNHVFIKLSGAHKHSPLEYSDVSALVRRLQKRTGIYFTVHMLRHSSLSELRRLGWPVEQLRIRAGHHFVQSTYVYLHADDEEMRQEWIRTENQMLLRKGSTKNESGL